MNLEGLTERRNRNGNLYFENDCKGIVAKQCSQCQEIKSLIEFGKDKSKVFGCTNNCKECRKTNDKKYRDVNRESCKKWRSKNKEYQKEYYSENKIIQNERSRQWYELHRERVRQMQREWAEGNKEKRAIISQRRKAREKSLPNDLTDAQYRKTLKHFGNACALTGRTSDLEIEHAIPISIGHGGTTFGNCYPMVNGLNQSKFKHNIFEWFEANRQRFNLEQERFDRLIEWLGKANGMTVEEYRDYVYECHANPNEISDDDVAI
jgi:hypothetical protein